jgi:hypothetical protein
VLIALGADASESREFCPTLTRKIGLPPAPVEFCSLLGKPNSISLKDGVVGVEGALRYAKREGVLLTTTPCAAFHSS